MRSSWRYTLTVLALSFTTILIAQSNKIPLRPRIENIVNKLRQEDEVHFGYPVGYSGVPETNNKYYKKYLQLKDKATNEELVALTQHISKPVVIYSFDILWKRQYPDLKNIFLQHLNDTT